MARTIEQIKTDVTAKLQTSFTLSTSATAEWRLWVHCMAYAIYMFEVTLDVFKSEMDADIKKTTAGTLTWYNDKCYEFQQGHELLFNTTTGLLEYGRIDEASRVIKIASVNVNTGGILFFRVATKDESGSIVPITNMQLINFKNYIDAVKFAGTKSTIISTDADLVRYEMTVYYNPATPVETIRTNVLAALEEFKTSQKFGGVIYRHKMLEAVTSVNNVITGKLTALTRKGTEDSEFIDIDTLAYLHAGYFNYTDDSTLTLTSINDI